MASFLVLALFCSRYWGERKRGSHFLCRVFLSHRVMMIGEETSKNKLGQVRFRLAAASNERPSNCVCYLRWIFFFDFHICPSPGILPRLLIYQCRHAPLWIQIEYLLPSRFFLYFAPTFREKKWRLAKNERMLSLYGLINTPTPYFMYSIVSFPWDRIIFLLTF